VYHSSRFDPAATSRDSRPPKTPSAPIPPALNSITISAFHRLNASASDAPVPDPCSLVPERCDNRLHHLLRGQWVGCDGKMRHSVKRQPPLITRLQVRLVRQYRPRPLRPSAPLKR